MTYWKVKFTAGETGFGFLAFDAEMIGVGLYKENGETITEPVEYHPVEFNVIPDWV